MNSDNIIVAGAGIMGLMSSYTLLKAGHAVTLYDPKGLPARDNASWIAGGMLAPYSEIDLMTPSYVQRGLESIAIWREITQHIGINDGLMNTGTLLIAHADDQQSLSRFISHVPEQAVARVKVRDLEPGLSFNAGYHIAREAALDPHDIMIALSEFLQVHDHFTFLQDAFTPEASDADQWVIDCRGMGADDPDLRGVKGEIAVVRNSEFSLKHIVRMMHPRYPLYIVPRADGLFTVGATQIESSANECVSVRSAMELLSALYSLHPSFGEAEIVSLQAGIRPAYPDNLPRIKRRDRVILINGLFRHGYLLSPVLARDMVAMVETAHTQEAA